MKKYQKLAEKYSKNLESHRFLVYHPSNDSHVTDTIADTFSKMVIKMFQENFDNTCIKSYLSLHPQMPTAKDLINNESNF